jgi:hypothetical protein
MSCVVIVCWRGVVGITGTLDPVRNLTGLIYLSVFTNALVGMFIFLAVGIVVVVMECELRCEGVARQHATSTTDLHVCRAHSQNRDATLRNHRHSRSSKQLDQAHRITIVLEQHRRYVHHRGCWNVVGCV